MKTESDIDSWTNKSEGINKYTKKDMKRGLSIYQSNYPRLATCHTFFVRK